MAYPRFILARKFKFDAAQVTNAAIGSTSWADLSTTNDKAVEAQVNDVLVAAIGARYNDSAASTVELDAVTMNGSTPVNSMANNAAALTGTTGAGVLQWLGLTGVQALPSGHVFYKVVSGDIFSGEVTVRLRYRSSTASPTRSLTWAWSLRNIGPVEVN